jgi:hypothetical protein
MDETIQVMLVALMSVCIGVLFDNVGGGSILFSTVGMFFIMGAFVIAISAFIIFMRDWITKYANPEQSE